MKAILQGLVLLTLLLPPTILASPLPTDCDLDKESHSSVFPRRMQNNLDLTQTRLGGSYYAKTFEDLISRTRTTQDDEGELDAFPTPINPADRPLATKELVQGVLGTAISSPFPSAPTGEPLVEATPSLRPICGTTQVEHEKQVFMWIVGLVIAGMVGLFFVAMSIVEVYDNIWIRWQGVSCSGEGGVRLTGGEQRLMAASESEAKTFYD